ncbi:MAG: 30S ribosomal protein S16 [Fimbriimonadales bacterium]|nr:30S ribosomal protein S16 [Fimbriimonadales bacterium]
MLRIRLMRMGKKKKPFYRVVVAPSLNPRSGRFVEVVGHYNPIPDPALIHFNEERVLYWLRVGAQPTETVQRLLKIAGVWQKLSGQEGTQPETSPTT